MDLKTVRTGDELYFVDKSEGPGVVIYIQGIAVDVGSTEITMEITDSGTLIAPGYLAPYEPQYKKGLIKLSPEDGEFLSTREFEKLKEQFQLVPENLERETPVEEKEDKDALETTPEEERVVPREEIEEEAPEYEPADESLYKVASLKSWSAAVGITWPKGFPQDWMERVYDDLPEGDAEKTPAGEPVVGIPGSKGPGVPPDFKESVEIEKQFNDASKAVQDARAQLVEVEKTDDKEAVSKAQLALKDAIAKFLKIKERAEEIWNRPPDETTYEQVPGRRAPYELSYGRAGLRQELKQLFDNYKKTLNLIDSIDETEKRIDTRQKEIDLLLSLRRKQLVDKSHGEGAPHYVFEKIKKTPYPFHRVPTLLKKLKYKELKNKPFLWTREERDKIVDAASDSAAAFEDRVGVPRTFFDLPPEEVDMYMRKEVEQKGAMAPEDVARLAWKYANEYKEFVKDQMGWKDLSDEIQKYLRHKHLLAISDERADRIEEEIYKKDAKSVVAKGRDVDNGAIRELHIPVQELFTNVVHKISENYEKRVKWLQFIQNGRKNALARQKGELRRALVEKENDLEVKEPHPIDDEKYKDAIVSIFHKYAKFSNEKGTSGKIPSKYRIHHGLPAFEEKSKELAGKKKEEADVEAQIKELENELEEAYAPYKRADDDLNLLQDDIGRITDPGTAQEDAQRVLDQSKEISDQIKKLISQREYLRKFYKNREGWEEKVKNISLNIEKLINSLEARRSTLFKVTLPKKTQAKFFDYDKKLKKTLREYEDVATAVETKMDALYSKLEKIRGEKSKIAEEIA